MLLCPITRTRILEFLPEQCEVAEIGVAAGDFSQDILTHARPRKLHLIDPWERQERSDYINDPSNVGSAEQDGRFDAVLSRFRAEIERGIVAVHREYSQDAAGRFAPGQLDWVYIDGMHTAEAAYDDLITYATKIRPEGFIMGHDYTNHVQAQAWNFGVVEAVNRFVLEQGYQFVALTMEGFPSYVLTRSPDSAQQLSEFLLRSVPYTVEIRDFPGKHRFEHKTLDLKKGKLVYPSF